MFADDRGTDDRGTEPLDEAAVLPVYPESPHRLPFLLIKCSSKRTSSAIARSGFKLPLKEIDHLKGVEGLGMAVLTVDMIIR